MIIELLQGDTVLGLFPVVNAADHVLLHLDITVTALYLGFGYRKDVKTVS